jgi:hypothetical protein
MERRMNRLSTLGFLVAGAIVLAAVYGSAFGDRDVTASIDFDDGEGVRHIVNGDRGEFKLRQEGLSLVASWRGDYELNADGGDIVEVDRRLEIKREQNGVEERAVYERDGGDVARTYFLDGEKQGDTPQTRAAMSALLTAYLGASGVKAEERVAILLRKGGPDAVIAEIEAAYGGHARQRYAVELVEQADLAPGELLALLTALKGVEGDHDLRQALTAVLDNEKIGADEMPLFLEAASRIDSDYDLRRLIEAVAEKPLNDDAMTLAIGLFEKIESDHDLRRAGEALLAQPGLAPDNIARLLSVAASQIDSDHDLRLLLDDSAPLLAKGDAVAAAWLEGFGALDSDHDRRLAIMDAAGQPGVSDAAYRDLIAANALISSDHDRRLALEAFAKRAKADPALRAAYEDAARAISSDSDRERALAAIGAAD